jgi:hypothetical protein
MDANQMGKKWKTRIVEGEFPGREFDIEFWQEQGDEAIFRAAWETGGVSRGNRTWQKTHTTENCYKP